MACTSRWFSPLHTQPVSISSCRHQNDQIIKWGVNVAPQMIRVASPVVKVGHTLDATGVVKDANKRQHS